MDSVSSRRGWGTSVRIYYRLGLAEATDKTNSLDFNHLVDIVRLYRQRTVLHRHTTTNLNGC